MGEIIEPNEFSRISSSLFLIKQLFKAFCPSLQVKPCSFFPNHFYSMLFPMFALSLGIHRAALQNSPFPGAPLIFGIFSTGQKKPRFPITGKTGPEF